MYAARHAARLQHVSSHLSSSLPPSLSVSAAMAPRTSSTQNNTNNTTTTKKEIKILMLHGYTQSGSLFRAKTGALSKSLTKAFPLHTLILSYPTGPLRLNPADIPGHTPSWNDPLAADTEIEAYAWWRRADQSEKEVEYVGLNKGLDTVARTLREEGPFDGVIGFSQGAALAYMVASLLETGRKEAFSAAGAAGGIPYPEEFSAENTGNHPRLKFAVLYSGFRAPGQKYAGFYENPQLQTPALHVLGSLDSVVEEARARQLVAACAGDPESVGRVVFHPGGHFVPSQKTYLDVVIGFVRSCLENDKKEEKQDEKVEDMELPF